MEVITQQSRRYDILVLLPLMFITVFCFGFVLMHPYYQPVTNKQPQASIARVSKHTNNAPAEVVEVSEPLPHLSTAPVLSTSKSTNQPTQSTTAVVSKSSSSNESNESNASTDRSALTPTKEVDQTQLNTLFQALQNLNQSL